MHELSIATAIADIARRHAGNRRVVRVEVTVGHLRQVVPHALLFSWELVCKDTNLDGAALVLEEIPAAGRCRACGKTGPLPDFPLACSACRSLDVEIVAGEELRVEALEVEDPSSVPAHDPMAPALVPGPTGGAPHERS